MNSAVVHVSGERGIPTVPRKKLNNTLGQGLGIRRCHVKWGVLGDNESYL